MYTEPTPAGRAAALGSPVGHLLSPVLHRAAYAAMRLDRRFETIECDVASLPGLWDQFGDDWAGLCLAAPLKRAVLPLVDEVSDLALDVGGADTVVFRHGRSYGHHTGVHGMTAALGEAGLDAPGPAVVLGGGAAACSALAALRQTGVREPAVVLRDPADATEIEAAAGRLGVHADLRRFDELARVLPGAAVVISTLPAHAADPLALAVARSGAVVLDAVCSAWPTRLAKAAAFAGGTVVDGLSMLLHRTVRQIELLTGATGVPVALLREAARAELLGRAARETEPAASGRKLL
jgi:shikimate dehydrogenase